MMHSHLPGPRRGTIQLVEVGEPGDDLDALADSLHGIVMPHGKVVGAWRSGATLKLALWTEGS